MGLERAASIRQAEQLARDKELVSLRQQVRGLWDRMALVEIEASYWKLHLHRMKFVAKFGKEAREQLNAERRAKAKQRRARYVT